MPSKDFGIFGLFSYKEFKYYNLYYGIEKNKEVESNPMTTNMFVVGQRFFKSLSSVSLNEFTENYLLFLTFLEANKFKNNDFVSYLLPKNIEGCYSKCFSKKKDVSDAKNIEVIYKHMITLTIHNVVKNDNDLIITLKSRIADDEFKLFVRSQSNRLEIIDDLVMFYEIPTKNENNYLTQKNILQMMVNNLINLVYVYDTEKLFPSKNADAVIKKIKKFAEREEIYFLANVEYILEFPVPMTIVSSQSFYISSSVALWNISYERKILKHMVLNLNKVTNMNNIEKTNYPFLIFDGDTITDTDFLQKITKCKKNLHDIIFLLENNFTNILH